MSRVVINLYQTPLLTRLLGGRPQRWRWRAVNAGNGRIQAHGGEGFANRGDALDSIDGLFRDSDLWLRQPGQEDQVLRLAVQDE